MMIKSQKNISLIINNFLKSAYIITQIYNKFCFFLGESLRNFSLKLEVASGRAAPGSAIRLVPSGHLHCVPIPIELALASVPCASLSHRLYIH